MDFTLFYQGKLKSNGSIEDKNAIRLKIHDQLQTLKKFPPLNFRNELFDKSKSPKFFQTINGHDYFHLVSASYEMYVEMEISMLIPHFNRNFGDIDNKLKTLFDALRPPKSNENSSWIPTTNQTPLLCLLEDDSLIFKVGVDTDYLLDTAFLEDPNFVIMTINVKVKGNSGSIESIDLIL